MTGATPGSNGNRAEAFEVVHARILRFLPELVGQLGGNLEALLDQAGIGGDTLAGSGPEVTYRQAVEVMELAANQLDCPDFGMRLAMLQGGSAAFGPLGFVMKNSRSFGDALDYVARHTYAHSLAARVWLRRSPADGTVFSGHDIVLGRMPNRVQAMEHILLAGHLAALDLTGGHARVRRVHFRHQPVSPAETYRRYFGCEVCFGRNEDGVVFSEQDLACQIVAPDAQAFERVTTFIGRRFSSQRPPHHAQARGMIMQLLATGDCTNRRIAAELNLHPRTLHRRLVAEGTTFQQVKDEVRRDIMLYYLLQTDLPFTEISEKLGFAEQSVMTRSCNRWFAASPMRMRVQARL